MLVWRLPILYWRPAGTHAAFTVPVTAYAAGLCAESLTCSAEFPAFTFLVSSTTAAASSTPIHPNTASANKAIIRIGMACISTSILERSYQQPGDHGH